MNLRLLIAILIAAYAPMQAIAAPCDGIWQKSLTVGTALVESEQVRSRFAFPQGKRRVYEHMGVGPWHIVWADWDISEPGAHIIRKDAQGIRLIENWGGVALRDEADDVERWAMSLDQGFPGELAHCFAWYVTIGRYNGAPTWPNPFNNDWEGHEPGAK